MTARDGTRLLALPPSAIDDRPVATLRDLEATLEPDAVWVLGPSREPRAFAGARRAFDAPTFHPPLEIGGDGPVRRVTIDGGGDGETVAVATVQGLGRLRASPEAVSRAIAEPGVAALVCDDVTTTVRPTALEATLEGAEQLADALPTDRITTVLTGSEPAGYDELWHLAGDTGAVVAVDHDPLAGADGIDGDDRPGGDCVSVRVRGVGPVEGYGTDRSVASLTLTAGGLERVDTHDVTDFGLEAVSGIGPKTAARLADRGMRTRTDLLETPVGRLTDLPGVGRDRARTMHHHATVLETGEPRRVTDESLPGEGWSQPPLCLDVETDGLSPTIIWQVGVYDPATDDYRAFVERKDPTDPASVLEAFCDWLLGIHHDRSLLTWNGWRFDYRHLGSFLARHVPYYVEEWESIPKFDLYHWAVRDGNALLPGRTNRLEAVAGALGYEDAATGLDGAETAAAYRRFMRTGAELEWDRHEAYCEDDCRALWHVYERLRDAPRASEITSSSEAVSGGETGWADPNGPSTDASRAGPTRSTETERDSNRSTETKRDSSTGDHEQTGLSDF